MSPFAQEDRRTSGDSKVSLVRGVRGLHTLRKYGKCDGTLDASRTQAFECVVRSRQWERLDLRPQRSVLCDRHEFLTVAPRQIGDRAQDPFAPEKLVREG